MLLFYNAKDGKLYTESEREIPTALKAESATEFSLPDNSHIVYRFTLASTGNTVAITQRDQPAIEFRRTGDAVHHIFHHYERREEMIPVRDGVKLHVVILTPTDIPGALPIR